MIATWLAKWGGDGKELFCSPKNLNFFSAEKSSGGPCTKTRGGLAREDEWLWTGGGPNQLPRTALEPQSRTHSCSAVLGLLG